MLSDAPYESIVTQWDARLGMTNRPFSSLFRPRHGWSRLWELPPQKTLVLVVASARRGLDADTKSRSSGVGAPPGWPLRAACEELPDDRYSRRKRGRRRDENAAVERRKAEVGAPFGAPLPSCREGNRMKRTGAFQKYGRRSVG